MASESDQMQRDLFQQFYVRVAPLLRGYIYRVCGDQALGDDIFQESFLKFLRTVRWNAPDRQQKAFIFKIAARLIIDNIRRIRPHPLDAAARTERSRVLCPTRRTSVKLSRKTTTSGDDAASAAMPARHASSSDGLPP